MHSVRLILSVIAFVAKPESFFVCAVFAVVTYCQAAAFAYPNTDRIFIDLIAAFFTLKTRTTVTDGYNSLPSSA